MIYARITARQTASLTKVIGVALVFAFSGCKTTDTTPTVASSLPASTRGFPTAPSRPNNLKAAAKDIGRNLIQYYAIDALDGVTKGNFELSSADALRSLEGAVTTAEIQKIGPLVRNILDDWLPDEAPWQGFTDQIAQLVAHYLAKHPGNLQTANDALEQVAQGLQEIYVPNSFP